MYKLPIKLKQHTPIIHFQYDQVGATLRATEVKPKLDRFILEKMGDGDYENGRLEAKENGWLIDNDKGALDYKMRFIQTDFQNAYIEKIKKGDRSIPFFFGNMGDDYEGNEKIFIFNPNKIECHILTFNIDLKEKIENCKNSFFLLNNFGTRQSKGFGSFKVVEESKSEITNPSNLYFSLNLKGTSLSDYKDVFSKAGLFYRALRAGINQKRFIRETKSLNDVSYVKSFLYLYFINNEINWEKKKIKTEFFASKLNRQKENRINIAPSPLHSNIETYNLIRDLLGLSSKESWQSYNSTIEKVQAKKINDNWVEVSQNKRNVDRFKSPITLKPILSNDNKSIVFFILLNQNSLDDLLSKYKDYMIKSGNNSFHIPMPDKFDLDSFFNFIKTINLREVVEDRFHNSYEFKVLDNILNQL